MHGVPIDAVYLWIGLSIASVAAAGAALAFHPAPAPAPTPLAETVDAVAASSAPASLSEPIRAQAIRIGPRRIALRSDGGHSAATYAYGPVTPVGDGPLRAVLRGRPPAAIFDSQAAFHDAIRAARRREPTWEPAGPRLHVRSVTWGEIDATLVGA